MNILLAEDNEDNYMVIRSNLRRSNPPVELIWTENGEEALKKLEEKVFDLVLLDIQMPVMDGMETIRRIRGDARFKDLPVVAVTASVFAEMKEGYMSEGFDAVLEKPFSRQELLDLIERYRPA